MSFSFVFVFVALELVALLCRVPKWLSTQFHHHPSLDFNLRLLRLINAINVQVRHRHLGRDHGSVEASRVAFSDASRALLLDTETAV